MLTIREAAKRLGISRSKLYGMTSRREIAFYRVGGKILFTEEQLKEFLDACLVHKSERAEAPKPPPVSLKPRHLEV